ncbi:TGB2 [Sweet potato C6 virus]|uniref:Movement protein TGB2 n=1 Tax=Sweet potato C6 virus TaxID=1307958 RepID=J7GU58_9VIRU|nr:TGB2 [Sweet potato C6 virus]AFP73390.1 TGB2 [Sweet potato C6 virus]AGH32542.1 triple gene block protein 2 [Sweet potato C6 virus]
MALTPPPDHSKSLLAICVGIAIALVLYSLTRSNLPHVGDNLHSLPHGGCYQDGTKSISYNSPARTYPASTLLAKSAFNPFLIVLLLSACIFILSKNQSHSCRSCRGYC